MKRVLCIFVVCAILFALVFLLSSCDSHRQVIIVSVTRDSWRENYQYRFVFDESFEEVYEYYLQIMDEWKTSDLVTITDGKVVNTFASSAIKSIEFFTQETVGGY